MNSKSLLDLPSAAAAIAQGRLLAYPTESVWGLGGDYRNAELVSRISKLKERPQGKGFILLGHSVEQMTPLMQNWPIEFVEKASQIWADPKTPTSVVGPAPNDLHPGLVMTNDLGVRTICLRLTKHPVASELCRRAATLLVSTSANLAAQQVLESPCEIADTFGDDIDGIVGGETGGHRTPSKIYDLVNQKWLR